MFRKLTLAAVLAVTASTAHAASENKVIDYDFSFEGPFGSFDQNQLQRGLKIYTEICPECAPDDMDGTYNSAFGAGGYPAECKYEDGTHKYPGSWIAMGQPLWGEDVEFDDGHANDLESQAKDVAAFLMWTAEPKMMARKQAGLTGVIFLIILSGLLYLSNKRLWAPHKKKH